MKLLISFDDRPKDFAHGVEFGRILEKIENGREVVENNGFPIRLQNQELVYRACVIYGYKSYFSECTVSGWVNFRAIKK